MGANFSDQLLQSLPKDEVLQRRLQKALAFTSITHKEHYTLYRDTTLYLYTIDSVLCIISILTTVYMCYVRHEGYGPLSLAGKHFLAIIVYHIPGRIKVQQFGMLRD